MTIIDLDSHRESCKHPASTRLRNISQSWCPWCGRSHVEDRAESLLAWLRAERRSHHAWAMASTISVSRGDVREPLRLLVKQGLVRQTGVAHIVMKSGMKADLRMWRAR